MKKIIRLTPQMAHALCENIIIEFVLERPSSIIINQLDSIEIVEFVNYDSWVWIKPLIMLKSRLTTDDAVKKVCKDKIFSVMNLGSALQIEINHNVFKRLLSGEIIGIDLLKQAEIDNDKEVQLEMLIKIIAQLVTVVEMGASDKFSVNEANQQLSEYMAIAKKLLK